MMMIPGWAAVITVMAIAMPSGRRESEASTRRAGELDRHGANRRVIRAVWEVFRIRPEKFPTGIADANQLARDDPSPGEALSLDPASGAARST